MNMEIRSLNNICLNELFEAFEQAFADYEVQLNKVELLTMLKNGVALNPKPLLEHLMEIK